METNYDKLIKYFTDQLPLSLPLPLPSPSPSKPIPTKINIKNIIKECSKIHFNLWDQININIDIDIDIDKWDCSAIDCSQFISNSENINININICEEIPIVLEEIIKYINNKKINIELDSLECSNFIARQCIINILDNTPDNEIPDIINLIINNIDINNTMIMLYQFSNTYCIFDFILKYNVCIDCYINKYGEDNFIELFLNKSQLKGPKPICRFFNNIDNLELSKYGKNNIHEKITNYLKLNKSLLLCSDKSILKHLLLKSYITLTNYIPSEIQDDLLTQSDFNIIVNNFKSNYYYEYLDYFLVNNINISDKLLREISLINNDSTFKEYEKINILDNNILIKIVFDPYCSIMLSKNTKFKNNIPIRDIIATYLINNNIDIFNDDNVVKTIEIDKNKIDIDILEMWKSFPIMYKYLDYMNDKYFNTNYDIKFKERIKKFYNILYDLVMDNSESELYINFCFLLCIIISKCDINVEYIIKILLNNTFISKLIDYKQSETKNKYCNIDFIQLTKCRENNEKLLFVLHLISIINDCPEIDNKNKNILETIIMLRNNNYDNINKKILKCICKYLDIEYIINKFETNIILKLVNNDIINHIINNNPEIIIIKSGILQEKLINKLINKNIITINTITQYIDNNSFNNNILLSIIKYTKNNNIIINYQKSFNNYILNKTTDDFTNDKQLLLWFIDNIDQLEIHKYIVNLINNSKLGDKILIQYFNSLIKLNKTNILYLKIITEYINVNYISTHLNELINININFDFNEIDSDIYGEFIFAIIGYVNIYSKKELLQIIIKMCNNKKYCDKICNNALSYIDCIPDIIINIITNEYWNTNIYNDKIIDYTNIKKYIDTIEYDYQIKFLSIYFEKNKPPSSYNSLKKHLINAPFMKIITKDTYNIIKSFDKFDKFDKEENIHINLFIKDQPYWILNNDNIISLSKFIDENSFNTIANNNINIICNNSKINFDSVILFANITKLTFDLTHIDTVNTNFENDSIFVKCYNEGLIKCNIENIINKKPNLLLSIHINDIIFDIIVKQYITDISFLSSIVIANLDNKLLCKLLDIIINYYYQSEPYELIKILDIDCTIYKYISKESCDKIKSLVQYDYNFIGFIKNCGISFEEICKLKSIDGNLIICNAMCINIIKYGEYVKYIDFDDLFIKDKLGKYVIENMWNSDEIKKLLTTRNDYKKIKSKIKKKNIKFYKNINSFENMQLNIQNTINVFMMKCVNEIDYSWLDNFSSDEMISLLLTQDTDNNYGLFYVMRYYPYWFKDNIDYLDDIGEKIISNKFGETLPMSCLRYSPKCYDILIENNIIKKKDCYISTICGSILTYSIKYYIEYFQSIICSEFFTPYTFNTYDYVNIIDFYTQDKLEFKTIVNIINILIVYRRDDEFTTLIQKYKNIVKKYIEEVVFINCDKYNSLKLALLYCPKIARIIMNSNIISNKYINETLSYFTDYEQFRFIGNIQPESWVYIIQSKHPEIVAFKQNEVNVNNVFGVRLNGNFIIESFKDNTFIKTMCHTQIYDYSDNNKCKLCLNCKENISYYCGHRLCVRCHVMRLWGNIPKCPYCSCEITNDKQVIYIG